MKKIPLKNLILTAIVAAVICIAAPITITIGVIPFTLSVFAVLLCGAILPPFYAMTATLVYIAIGAVGMPVFSMYSGGFAKLIGPTGGYLWAYPLMAMAIAFSVKLFKKRGILSLSIGMFVALIICYTFGTAWFSYINNISFYKGLKACVFPFILPDMLKAAAAIILTLSLNRFTIFHNRT